MTTTKMNSKANAVKNESLKVSLTAKENKTLTALVNLLDAEAGFSDIECADLAKATKFKVEEVKGIIGSLTAKELVYTSKTETFGAPKQYDIIYLSPMAWSLHPSWKEESEFNLEVTVAEETAVKPKAPAAKKSPATTKPKATTTVAKTEDVKSLNEEEQKSKPYSVYGLHGKNKDLEGFKKGDEIIFTLKGKEVTGVYTHLHTNNWSPQGYVVIKFDGKIYERVPAKVKKPVTVKAVAKKAPAKKTTVVKKTAVAPKKTK